MIYTKDNWGFELYIEYMFPSEYKIIHGMGRLFVNDRGTRLNLPVKHWGDGCLIRDRDIEGNWQDIPIKRKDFFKPKNRDFIELDVIETEI